MTILITADTPSKTIVDILDYLDARVKEEFIEMQREGDVFLHQSRIDLLSDISNDLKNAKLISEAL